MTELMLNTLFQDAPETIISNVKGKWFPIRLTPDIATGELFNVGIGFIEDGKRKNRLHVKMLSSARGFKCMYGTVGLENFTFLLTIVGEQLRQSQKVECSSEQISFGSQSYASGESTEAILGRLFETMVPLSRHCEDEQAISGSPGTVSSEDARSSVFTQLYQRAPVFAADIIRNAPLRIKTHGGREIKLDVPLRKPNRFGTIASAFYRQDVYISNNLNTAMRDMLIAQEHAEEDRDVGGIFILRAPTDGRYFTESLQRWIDEEIEQVRESLYSRNILVREAVGIPAICQEIQNWAN
ncbi:MAG: hypothetical protein Q7T66_17625 [Herminiimonas sp.]|uniref:hypothetical protein n=1 Tax=Herminiimonas sp. TaxID=1926289 RepID=UPI0027218659|nr:hypothetical protein [Herminiimonas sp.]MDO9422484.1 hypothetical protein [Herminiimonas sp.]